MHLNFSWHRAGILALRIACGALCLVLLSWLLLGWYVHTHAAEIKVRISRMLSAEVQGDLHIGQMTPSFFRNFPNVSLVLADVSLRDSLWQQHRHSLLEAREVSVELNPFALFSRRVELKKVTIAHGSVFVYVDERGYSNTYLLARRDTTKANHPALADHFRISDMQFWLVNKAKQKEFHFYLQDIEGAVARSGGVMTYSAAVRAHVHELAFSTIRGSYLREQDVQMDARAKYYIASKRLELPEQQVLVSGLPIIVGGNFYFDRSPAAFDFHLHAREMPYATAVALVSQNISRLMQPYDFSRPMQLDARVSGVMEYHNIPLITVKVSVQDNTLKTPLGAIDSISFVSIYHNEVVPGSGHGDDNTSIALHNIRGRWAGIPFSGDSLLVINLLRPYVRAHVQSAFPVTALNDAIGSKSFSFESGTANADIRYKGGISPQDTTPYSISGVMQVKNVGMAYLPRRLSFAGVSATLLFEGDNLFFRNVAVRSRGSSLTMEGEALHFTRLYFADPGKVSISWKVRGSVINIDEFISAAGKPRAARAPRKAQATAIARIGAGLDRVLAESSIALDAQTQRLTYKKVLADDVVAQIAFGQSGIFLRQISLRHGGGTVFISGSINQAAPNNPFRIAATVRNADVARLFSSFDNFGQKAITAENLQGKISADANIKGNITDGGAILPASIFGSVKFGLKEGRIIGFAPFEKVGQFVFKKRDLSDVQVADLQGQLNVAGAKIYIQPMTIKTSVLEMRAQGVYGLNGGTDIYLEVPLRNPAKESPATLVGKLLRRGKGFVIHLRAQDPDGTGVRIGWDPLRKGQKATDAALSGNEN